jgi:hypothetical protein
MAKRRRRRSRRASTALTLALSGFVAPFVVRRSRRRLKVDEDRPNGYLFVQDDDDDQ